MKKLFIFILVFVASASLGGILRLATVHADSTITPAQAAVLQQSLDTMKAELLELQAKAAAQTGAPVPAPAVSGSLLTPSDTASLSNALSLLSGTLAVLQSRLAQNPQFIAGREGAVLSALKGMGTMLAMIGTTLAGNANVPVAVSAPSAVAAAPAPQTPTPAPVSVSEPQIPVQTAPAANPANAAPQTAQVGSLWSFKNLNWPLLILIVLVIIAVITWLFWPGDEKSSPAPAPAVTPISTAKPMMSPEIPMGTPIRTPIATTAVATSVEKSPQSPQQSHQQRKPA